MDTQETQYVEVTRKGHALSGIRARPTEPTWELTACSDEKKFKL